MKASKRPTLNGSQVEVPEARYRADLELHDRYQAASTEFIRIAVAALGFVGVALKFSSDAEPGTSAYRAVHSVMFFVPIGIGIASLVVTLGAALLHKYLAADGMHHHLRAIKLLIHYRDQSHFGNQESDVGNSSSPAAEDEMRRNERFSKAGTSLFVSAASLLLGVASIAVAMLTLLR